MTPWRARAALGALYLGSSVGLVRCWYRFPDRFPTLLQAWGNAAIDWLGVASAEQAADLELVYVVLVACVLVGCLFLGGWVAWKCGQAWRY